MAAPSPASFLRGERVHLAPPEPEHAEVLARWLNDPEVWVPFGMDVPVSIEAEKAWIAAQDARKDEVNFLIFDNETGRPLGLAGLRNIDGTNGTARLGVLIGESESRGNGLGTEAVRLLLSYGFDYLGLRRVNLAVLAGNEPALRMYQKLGFVSEGTERKAQLRGGEFTDRLHLGLFREEFLAGAGGPA